MTTVRDEDFHFNFQNLRRKRGGVPGGPGLLLEGRGCPPLRYQPFTNEDPTNEDSFFLILVWIQESGDTFLLFMGSEEKKTNILANIS